MLGIYEHKRWFRYEPVLEVREEGIECLQHLYRWGEIENVRRYRAPRGAGYGSFLFSDGAKRIVNLRTFRKKGDKLRVSFFGDNQTFDALKKYILRQHLESLKDPGIIHLEKEIDDLQDELSALDASSDSATVEKRLNRAVKEHLRLSDMHAESAAGKIRKWG